MPVAYSATGLPEHKTREDDVKPRFHMFTAAAVSLASAWTVHAQTAPEAPVKIQTLTPFTVQEQVFRKLSDHVWEIPDMSRPGNPNILIVVGARATLVVDSGMGAKSGEVVARRVQSVSTNKLLYLVTSDFRPEHITGGMSLPDAVWIVPEGQKADIHNITQSYIDSFTARSVDLANTLKGVKLREPDITFDRSATVDLGGGVIVKLFWFGPAFTNGDVAVFIEPDKVLYGGNFLGSKSYPSVPKNVANLQNWMSVMDKLDVLHPVIVVPNHGDVRDGTLIASQREVLRDLQLRAHELRAQGVSADEAGGTLTAEFDPKHVDWKGLGAIPAIVRSFYAEP